MYFIKQLLAPTFILLFTWQTYAWAQIKCTDQQGVITGYAQSADLCPALNSARPIDKVAQPTSTQTAQAKAQADHDKHAVKKIELAEQKQAAKDQKMLQLAQKKQASKEKACKMQALKLKDAQAKLDESRRAGLNQPGTKASKKAGTTVVRPDEAPKNKTTMKAQRQYEMAQAKYDLHCK